MEKPTKRKAFNFLRSYFDVLNELDKDADKLAFLLSIIDKQFLDEDPTELNFIVNLCYSSQKHAIESSVKGWKRASKTTLEGDPMTTPPTTPPTNPMTNPKEEEEEEEEKEEEKEELVIERPTPKLNELTEEVFLKRWCDARTHYDKLPTNIKKLTTYERIDFNELRQDYGLKDFERAMQGLFQQKTFPKTRLRPSHYLKREHFETYLTCFTTKEKLFDDNKYKKPVERI